MARKPADTVKLNLRFPEALRRQLERVAANNQRSMNAEIVSRLEDSFRQLERRDDREQVVIATVEHLSNMGWLVDEKGIRRAALATRGKEGKS